MFDNFCSLFSNNALPGQYAYQAFKKVPSLNLLIQADKIFAGKAQGGLINNLGNISTLANLPRNLIGVNNSLTNIRNFGKVSNTINQFINNVPLDSIKANDSNLQKIINHNQNAIIKKVLKSNYHQLIIKHTQSNQLFTDQSFPPNQQSMGSIQGVYVNTKWKRISQIIRNPEFISGKIQPSDIIQGNIGDCYFLSSISALAQNDFRIKNLFPDLKINPHCIYMARILYNGVLTEVVVDDYVPVNIQGHPLFSKPAGGKQIWVMILEKCWAKLHGSYSSIVGGLPNQVLHAFSGAPTFYKPINSINKQKQKNLWKEVLQAHEKGAILCGGTKGQLTVQKAGLIPGHAYTIIDVYDQPYQLLKIRNPWGKKQWNGRASQEDHNFWNQISPTDKQRFNYIKGNDGIFFMLWQDFINYFDMIDICKINDNASYMNLYQEFNKKRGQFFQFTTSGGNVTISLSQKSLRGQSDQQQRKGYSRNTLIVGKYQQASKGYEYIYIDSTSSKLFAENTLQLKNLDQGSYVIFAKVDWTRSNIQKATVSIYSQSQVTLKSSKKSSHKQFLFKVFLDHSRKNDKKQILSQQPKQWICSQFLLNKCGYGYLSVHLDQKSKRKIGIQINQREFIEKRLVLKKPYRGQGTVKTLIEPGKQLIILFRMKASNYPNSITLPTPKFYNLI